MVAMENLEKSRALIQKYLGKPFTIESDGVIFDEPEPAVFTLRFVDPEKLRDEIREMHTDEMDMEPWSEVVPVAAVSVPARGNEDFAWIFLDWRDAKMKPQTRYNRDELEWQPIDWSHGHQPSILVATHDNWNTGDAALSAESLEALLGGGWEGGPNSG